MDAHPTHDRTTSLSDAENWFALGSGALLLLVGVSRRSAVGTLVAASSAPLLYRGITGHWPLVNGDTQPDSTKEQHHLEEHSLPGTNQAGQGPGSREKNDQQNRPSGAESQHQRQLEEHSLPGTNQAGKGPGSREKNDHENRPGAGRSQHQNG
jgi:hypothetical protein